jgi:hypothetical protein
MILVAALASVLATASPAGLDEARAAFSAGDYARAERLAVAAAETDPAPALYLAGLARFRDGRPAEALEALDRAEAGADSPAAWRFNRGACLYELDRHAEAEAAFLEAAADPAWEALALVNAGFAALDGEAPERARMLAARARVAAAGGAALPLVEELEQALEPGTTARTGAAWLFSARAEAGFDDDALRAGSGAVERPGQVATVGSGFLAGGGAVEVGVPTGRGAVVASYSLAQLAYLDDAAEDHSVLQHDVLLALRGRATPDLPIEAAILGQYALAGLSNRRGLQAAVGLRLAGAQAWGGGQVTRAEASLSWKDGVGAEFEPLDGTRLELAASHEVRLDQVLLRAGYRFQLERIGAVTTALPPVSMGTPICMSGCTATGVEPLSYQGHAGWLAARLEPWTWLRLDLLAGLEGRWGLDDLHTLLQPVSGGAALVTGVRRRTDLRGFGSEALALRAASWLQLSLRHEWLANRTELDGATGVQGGGPRSGATSVWDKHVLTAGAAFEW